jgi:hypothetical protein
MSWLSIAGFAAIVLLFLYASEIAKRLAHLPGLRKARRAVSHTARAARRDLRVTPHARRTGEGRVLPMAGTRPSPFELIAEGFAAQGGTRRWE